MNEQLCHLEYFKRNLELFSGISHHSFRLSLEHFSTNWEEERGKKEEEERRKRR